MGLMDKIKRGIGTNDNYDDYEDDYYNEFDGNEEVAGAQNAQNGVDPMATQGIGLSGLSQMSSGISLSGTALELKVVKPQHFDSVPQIADHLLNKRTVVLNLEKTNKETARRLIDFLSGVAYSIGGSLKRITANTYIITASNVDIGDAQLKTQRKPEPQPEPEPAPVDDFADFN